jgi:trehalose/maltose hydrolase-like predicted phosphorylase
MIPKQWASFSFNIRFRGRVVHVLIGKHELTIELLSGDKIEVVVNNTSYTISEKDSAHILHHSKPN